jgi:hypothetical protein
MFCGDSDPVGFGCRLGGGVCMRLYIVSTMMPCSVLLSQPSARVRAMSVMSVMSRLGSSSGWLGVIYRTRETEISVDPIMSTSPQI